MKLRDPSHEVVVLERNKPDDTFGWGVVLSDETLDNLAANDDPKAPKAIHEHFAYWDDIAVVHKGQRIVSTGHGFCGIGRKQMLILLQDRAANWASTCASRPRSTRPTSCNSRRITTSSWPRTGSTPRPATMFEDEFKPDIQKRACKFVWLGTHQKFDDAFTFIFEKTEHGWVWVHAYQFDKDTATFIVECTEETYENWGFGEMSQEENIATCEKIFADHLGGHSLMSNAKHLRGSAWLNFNRVLCEKWHHENVVLLGDASATAHFSIGSGSKLAFESAIALADFLHSEPTMEGAFRKYRKSAGSMCSGCSRRPAIRPNGSRRSSAISTSIPSSSTIRS
jgi:anthraniloyl-CoA monooxygenase